MKRPEQHVIDTEAQLLLRQLVPSEWVVRDLHNDYGVDFEIEIADQHVVSGNRVWVQLKGVRSALKQRELNEPHPFWPDRPVPQRYVSYAAPVSTPSKRELARKPKLLSYDPQVRFSAVVVRRGPSS